MVPFKPTFQVRDTVRYIGGDNPTLEGMIGKVTMPATHEDGTLAVSFPGYDGHCCGNTLDEPNGWWVFEDDIEHANPDDLDRFIVARQTSAGRLKPSINPRIHPSKTKAVEEAERLAHDNPEIEFAVLKQISVSRATISPVETTYAI